MASAYEKKISSAVQDDELDSLFKTFDNQFHELQSKFSDMERTLQEFRSEEAPDEEDSETPRE